jgi:protoporphyrinogen/coproporphyrinogen III oxidase
MIRMTTNENCSECRTVVIIGGGITGLAAAYSIQEQARKNGQSVAFVLIEADERLGGKIQTHQVDDFTIEAGPDCFIRQKPWASDLCLRLGLDDELMGTNDHQRKVYVLNHGRLAQLPDGVMLIVPTRMMPFITSSLISWPGKIRMGLDLFIPPFRGDADESVGDFVRRRLGREALEKIAEPLMSGIHVSDPEEQSLLATFPRFRNIEKKHGSLIKGMLAERRNAARNHKPSVSPSKVPATIFVSLRSGLGKLVETLEAHLTDGRILRGVRAVGLEQINGEMYRVSLEDGTQLDANAVVLATPAFVSADLLAGLTPRVSDALRAITYVSTATISLAFRKSDLHRPFMGHGLVVPKKEKRKISACTWTSFKFNNRAPDDNLLLRCFIGGPGHEDQVDLPDQEILELVRAELKDLLSIEAEPVLWRIYRWHKANPQYSVGHLDRVRAIHAQLGKLPGLYLTGSAYEGVGVPDCIHQGEQTAQKVMEYFSQSSSGLEPAPVQAFSKEGM